MNDFYKFRFQNACLPRSQYSQDVLSLLNNPAFSDVQFLVGYEIVHANKAILACRSEYFKNIFAQESS